MLVRGTAGALAFMLGLAVGDVVWLTAAILGLAFIAKTFALAFLVLKYAGAAYLALPRLADVDGAGRASDASAPKAEQPLRLLRRRPVAHARQPEDMVFYLALLPNLIDLAAVTALGYAELVAVTFVVLTVVDGGYVLLAARARRLFTSPRARAPRQPRRRSASGRRRGGGRNPLKNLDFP